MRTTSIESWVQEVASSTRGRSHQQLIELSSNIQTQGSNPYQFKTRQPTKAQKRGRKRKSVINNHEDDIPSNKKKARGRPKKVLAQEIPILLPALQRAISSRLPA